MVNLNKLRKSELLWLASHNCKHGHTFLSHISCAKDILPPEKILLFDIETTPHEGYFWGKNWKTNIIEQIEYGKILCFAAKFLGGKMIFHGWNEKQVVKELWKLFNEADVLIAHNGKSFDIKWANTKFLQYNLELPFGYKVIDTRLVAKKLLNLPDYSLNTIADYYGLGRKKEHRGFPLWKDCMAGDRKAQKEMEEYNKWDVELLERVYLKLK